jgi:hypothetical protein
MTGKALILGGLLIAALSNCSSGGELPLLDSYVGRLTWPPGTCSGFNRHPPENAEQAHVLPGWHRPNPITPYGGALPCSAIPALPAASSLLPRARLA